MSKQRICLPGLNDSNNTLIPRIVIVVTALICESRLVLIAILGPLGLKFLQYRTSQSGIWQLMG